MRLTRAPVASIALIRGRATGNGSETALACDMSFASREKAIISQWEAGVGMIPGGGPMARLPRLSADTAPLEVLLTSEDFRRRGGGLGYINRAMPDAELDAFVDATRDPDRRVRQVGDREHQASRQHQPAAGCRVRRRLECVHRFARAARAQEGIKALMARGFHKPGDLENRLGYHLGQLAR